jgi:hypothetical protein
METENESYQSNLGQTKKSESQPNPNLNLREEIRKFLRVKNRVEARKKEQKAKELRQDNPKQDMESSSMNI